MEISPKIESQTKQRRYLWRIRWQIWRRNFTEFLGELRKHPIALLGGIVIIIYIVAAIFADQITVHDPTQGNLRERLNPPAWHPEGSWEYPLGTDSQGRDLLTRIIYGARVSLIVGLFSVGISVTIGLLLGTVAGYFRGRFDSVVSRFADLLLAFPFLIFAIGVMAFLGSGFWILIVALTFKGWVEFFRLSRGEMLSEKTQEYVEAAKVTGHNHSSIMGREILPNIIQSVFVLATLRIGFMIIMEASLSFLGLGIPPHIPAWGSMVSAGRDFMLVAPWVSTFPGLAIVFLVLSINLFGEGLRDILDPRLKVEG
ncbi:MAG: ABC transporter permease [Anaerolineales bacterium]|nr:ABC transporter permease [Anaerolineales bacterium]MCK5314176.1 ABC transporter permease [Anaerolineales bacterium]MCK5429599.1 ABC transporter permease [Anaerolineales bacterium]